MYIKVRVKINAKVESVVEKATDHLEISVTVPPENNVANERVLALVREHFQVYTGSIRIVNGHHSPSKIISLDN